VQWHVVLERDLGQGFDGVDGAHGEVRRGAHNLMRKKNSSQFFLMN
jgi:hypothetical protein